LDANLADVAGFGQGPPGDHRPDPVQPRQAGARRLDEGGDVGADGLEPGVDGADVGLMGAGDRQPHPGDVITWPDPGEQRFGLGDG
jgi:hypothetical protein